MHTSQQQDLLDLKSIILDLRTAVLRAQDLQHSKIENSHPAYRSSTTNLIHYTTIRGVDLRPLQLRLMRQGLSSLGLCESHVLNSLEKVLERLDAGDPAASSEAPRPEAITWNEAEELRHSHARAVFGPKPKTRHVYIMVTAPSAEEMTDQWLERNLSAGMNCLRINTAHGAIDEWVRMIHMARAKALQMDIPLKIFADLPGPKFRVVGIPPGPRVMRVRPKRDEWGRTIERSSIALNAMPSGTGLGLPEALVDQIEAGDVLEFEDTRGRKRRLMLEKDLNGAWAATCDRTYYFDATTRVELRRQHRLIAEASCAAPAAKTGVTRVRLGCRMALTELENISRQEWSNLPVVGCSLGGVLGKVEIGSRVLFDDGKVWTVVKDKSEFGLILEVVRCSGDVGKISNEKGINFPDTDLGIGAITEEDLAIFGEISRLIDAVCISFVQDPHDVAVMQRHMQKLNRESLGLILKLETRQAVAHLPRILCQAMRTFPVGIMIARGDLAVECGFERLAELQEEIMWLCEAAHIPVIWATQVLENLAKTGIPSRAEISDAAMSVGAECVMLNKGDYIDAAVRCLDEVLSKMEMHHYKKASMMRALNIVHEPLGS